MENTPLTTINYRRKSSADNGFANDDDRRYVTAAITSLLFESDSPFLAMSMPEQVTVDDTENVTNDKEEEYFDIYF